MAAESEQPTPREHERSARTSFDTSPEREQARPERFGPLALQRTRKDDGRALLLFSRAEERDT